MNIRTMTPITELIGKGAIGRKIGDQPGRLLILFSAFQED